jgi:hypothetical protein
MATMFKKTMTAVVMAAVVGGGSLYASAASAQWAGKGIPCYSMNKKYVGQVYSRFETVREYSHEKRAQISRLKVTMKVDPFAEWYAPWLFEWKVKFTENGKTSTETCKTSKWPNGAQGQYICTRTASANAKYSMHSCTYPGSI